MDSFEGLIRLLLDQEGYWTRISQKVNLTKEEKREIGKHSIPRPEIDVIAYRPSANEIIAMEVKSFLDSPGVKLTELDKSYDVPEGRYKLFTCGKYREIVFSRLKLDLIKLGLADHGTKIKIGLAAGKIYSQDSAGITNLFCERDWLLWDPKFIANKMKKLSEIGYENDPYVLASKLIHRNPVDDLA
ncbi:hypothetical protein [Ruegeria atlantica]|uniref:hypothetical protein n=1 Tax=Ruegeria atlantica TaxID=81569 RepID=UPI002495131E|nr:hypothetical protein [Ruegeria atlantica]